MQEQQKSVVETDSKSSKIIDPGEMRQAARGAKGRATTKMYRTILGKRPALAAEGEKQVFSSPNSVLISPCEHPNDLWTQPKVSSDEKASRLPPIRSPFFHHYDWNRWFASLATTVDNTIKMADRSFKHGRQWCIRRIVRIFGKWKCEFIANRATMVTSLPSLSLSLSLSLSVSLSLSLSLSLSHRKYLTHNIGSASALPIIIRFHLFTIPALIRKYCSTV